jgi:fructose-1,6-bisphosphatase/inositol monophosphatase family enzyme
VSLTLQDFDALSLRLAALHDRLVDRMPDKRAAVIGDSTTAADLDLEEAFGAAAREYLGSAVAILGEEAVSSGHGVADFDGLTLILDPIDGTRLFREGSRNYSCTFALCDHGRLFGGCIYLPGRDIRYVALRDDGLYRNGERVVFMPRRPERVVAVRERDFPDPSGTLANLAAAGLRIERLESTARRLADVATGRLAGFAKYVGHTHGVARLWGIGAGLIACEAGGLDIWLDRPRRILAVGEPTLMTTLIKSGLSDLSPVPLDDAWNSLSHVEL